MRLSTLEYGLIAIFAIVACGTLCSMMLPIGGLFSNALHALSAAASATSA
jgi:fucose permease